MSPTENEILNSISSDEVIELARDLIRTPSITGREGAAISDFLADYFRANGITPILLESAPGRINVIAKIESKEPGPTLVLNGHLDTKQIEGMSIEPFSGEIKDGRLYGRGSADMKAGVAALAVAMVVIKRSGIPIRGTLSGVFEVGEEGGGWTAEDLEKASYLDGDLAIVAEPTNLRVEIGNRGIWRANIKVKGRSTHSGTAQKGINAIQKAAKLVEALYRLPYLQNNDPIWGQSAMNVESIASTGWRAAVPDECTFSIDSRFNWPLTGDQVTKQVRGALDQLAFQDSDLKYEFMCDPKNSAITPKIKEPACISTDEKIVQITRGAVREILGKEASVAATHGYTMAARFIKRGIPAVVLGPGHLEQAHSADEYVEVDQIAQAVKIYILTALRSLSLKDN
jgi:succinyl-diaminopimelate desuccinylase